MTDISIPSPLDPIAAYRARCASENRAPAAIPTPHAASTGPRREPAETVLLARKRLARATAARVLAEGTERRARAELAEAERLESAEQGIVA